MIRTLLIFVTMLLAGCASTASNPQLKTIARDAQGRVGLCAQVIETGERIELDAVDRYPMQSAYKTAIAMTMLRQIDQGKFELRQRITVEPEDFVPSKMHSPLRERSGANEVRVSLGELIRLAVSDSDGTASDVLLREVGSCDAVMRFLREIDVPEINIATTEHEMGVDNQAQYRSWATPRGMVRLMIAVHNARGISRESQAFLIRCMINSRNSNKRIKAGVPEGTELAHKTGSSDTVDGVTAATNDTGIITLADGRHLAIAIFVSDSRADNDTREDVIARLTRAVYDQVTGASK